MPSNTEFKYSKAFSWEIALKAANAFLLHVLSLSVRRNVRIRSGASGIRCSEWENMDWIARTEFLRTYAWRCSRHWRADDRRGSRSSASRTLQRKRRVAPRMYSFAWRRSFRIPLLYECSPSAHPAQISIIPSSINPICSTQKTILTKPKSFPVSTSHWHHALDISHNKSIATS